MASHHIIFFEMLCEKGTTNGNFGSQFREEKGNNN